MNTQGLETERKYLIRMPDAAFLSRGEVWEIRQTYLTAAKGSRRVREVRTRDKTQYIYTEKERVSAMTSVEREREIDLAAYRTLLADARPDSAEVVKTRYRIPYAGHTLEIDVYPFWSTTAVLWRFTLAAVAGRAAMGFAVNALLGKRIRLQHRRRTNRRG